MRRTLTPAAVGPDFVAFWSERRICLLATTAADGTPHVVAVGVTVDVEAGVARVLARSGSQKVRNVLRHGDGGARVAVTGVDGPRWSTLQGTGVIRTEPDVITDGMRRYAVRYERMPTPHPERVVLEIAVDRILGSMQ
ncbi:pyridoxamine 5'-phosphate oxidase family protein [Pseudonocardia sp. GCM10023141]|uniref:pyridoxamine 5'-phosphate oxidase family protein n=1 Tax=Pseudonocardia sp. GCM10023141 TaxID=3252653 RepID=UPI003619D793